MTKTFALAGIAALMLSTAAGAQSLSFGVGLTSDYMSRGMTNSNNRPALQPWAEYENSGFYVGVWASNVDLGADRIEVDLYGGYRWSTNNTNFDLGYARYFYDSTGDAGGELYALVSHDLSESGASLFAGMYVGHAGGLTLNDAHGGISIPIADRLSGSARVGVSGAGNVYGNMGVTYSVNDRLDVDARVHRGNAGGPRYVLSAAFSF